MKSNVSFEQQLSSTRTPTLSLIDDLLVSTTLYFSCAYNNNVYKRFRLLWP